MKVWVYRFYASTGYCGENLDTEEEFEERIYPNGPDIKTLEEYAYHYEEEVLNMYGREDDEEFEHASCVYELVEIKNV